jgi:hypothetical protein
MATRRISALLRPVNGSSGAGGVVVPVAAVVAVAAAVVEVATAVVVVSATVVVVVT